MNRLFTLLCKPLATLAMVAMAQMAQAAEVVYRIVEYNKTTGEFILAASGQVPQYSWAWLENEYGATTGNRYNQIPRNRKATLYLEGWQGCRINAVTLSMCSNNKAGQMEMKVADGDSVIYSQRNADFASETWFGQWVSKDLGVYVDITKQIDSAPLVADEAALTIAGGTHEGSVYLNAITIDYDGPQGTSLVSPMGWTYEKLGKKSVIADGDEVMIYRNGCAATDIDGMETSHYLDAVPLASTADVADHDILCFTLHKVDGSKAWTFTDQYGRKLGATGKQTLAWNLGATAWNIELGYDGATITSENESYGTMRYNEPEGSYARFNVYTSKSLDLPFLYRKGSQREPVLSRSLTFAETALTATLDEGHVALHPAFSPSTTTDQRIVWSTDNEAVATVNGGFVMLHGVGTATITARAKDGGAQADVVLTVTPSTAIDAVECKGAGHGTYKVLEDNRVVVKTNGSPVIVF